MNVTNVLGLPQALVDADKMAEELGAKHYVEVRPGTDKKCTRYCSCCEFCNYYREHYGTEGTDNTVE